MTAGTEGVILTLHTMLFSVFRVQIMRSAGQSAPEKEEINR